MPEAAGSSSPCAGDSRHMAVQAGFPQMGGPLFGLGSRWAMFALCALLIVSVFAALPTAALAKGHHAKAFFGEIEAGSVEDATVRVELVRISRDFQAMVTARTLSRFGAKSPRRRVDLLRSPGRDYLDHVRADALERLRSANADLGDSQFFVYADRNPATQILFLAFYDARAQRVVLLGADFISSGKLRPKEDSFITPVGVFENLPDHWGYRAEGTKNNKGWRGLGGKGSRVWDFGYQQAPRQFRQGVYDSQMRLLMHATDPDRGEPRLGGPDSKGCVRVSSAANAFLDRHAILDRHYERIAQLEKNRDMWLLRPDRLPVSLPGSYLVIGDSSMGSASR